MNKEDILVEEAEWQQCPTVAPLLRQGGMVTVDGKRFWCPTGTTDLLRLDFVPLYNRLGRECFVEILAANPDSSPEELRAIMEMEDEA